MRGLSEFKATDQNSQALDTRAAVLVGAGKCLGAGCQVRVVGHFDVVHGALSAYSTDHGFGPFAGRDDTLAVCLVWMGIRN